VPFGGPLRLRVPRQLGYKSLKYLTHITVTDDIKEVRQRKGIRRSRLRILLVRGDLKRAIGKSSGSGRRAGEAQAHTEPDCFRFMCPFERCCDGTHPYFAGSRRDAFNESNELAKAGCIQPNERLTEKVLSVAPAFRGFRWLKQGRRRVSDHTTGAQNSPPKDWMDVSAIRHRFRQNRLLIVQIVDGLFGIYHPAIGPDSQPS